MSRVLNYLGWDNTKTKDIMDITEVRNRKEILEEEIETLLDTFFVETGAKIDELYIWVGANSKWVVVVELI